ncbi:MAG: hypothetical protein J1F67_09590 [Muribaculaceae bacterium]|nr:hypothetical protein [Muribaculaceae bacterium]
MLNSEIISKIIESNLLAASPSRLAVDLGYAGRMTINRLRTGTAGEEATHEFCNRLNDLTGLTNEDLIWLGRMLENTDDFNDQMISEFGELTENSKYDILFAFISDDYSIFSPNYRDLKLNRWLLMKGHEKDSFFFMLSLFLFVDHTKSFYDKHLSTKDRYNLILDPLLIALKDRYPKHSIGNTLSSGILETPMAKLAFPCFLTCVRLGGIILKGYVSGYSEASSHDSMIKIDGLPNRTFWNERENHNEVIFLKFVPVNDKGNGIYEYFIFNFKTGKTENPAQLYFYGEDLGLFLKKERKLVFGNCCLDDMTKLKIILYIDRYKKSEFVWKRLMPENSERVREIDRLFTDSYINNVKYESLGMELSCGVIISEVVVTKTKVILITLEGNKFSISRNSYPFLTSVTPDMIPLAYRDMDNNKLFIEWEKLGCRIPLEEFSPNIKDKK